MCEGVMCTGSGRQCVRSGMQCVRSVVLFSYVDGLKFLPQLWSNLGEKRTKTRSIHVHKLDFKCFK